MVVNGKDWTGIINIIRKSLNYVDSRLVSHGERVAYIVYRMMKEQGGYDEITLRDVCLLSLFHDIGAYKTEEIDRMTQFETNEVWEHSVYGYAFLKALSPLKDTAAAILYHHLEYEALKNLGNPCEEIAQMMHAADRLDMLLQSEAFEWEKLDRGKGTRFSPKVLDLLQPIGEEIHQKKMFHDEGYVRELFDFLKSVPVSYRDQIAYLRMIVYAIDFRSPFTVTHTITTTSISRELGSLAGLEKHEDEKLALGALLHDLGKIGIPVEILEFPGKLTKRSMAIMETHVTLTREILEGGIDEEVLEIAVRHHEKLDGSGYPKGLTGDQLTLSQRIVAVADLVSALSGERSYKKPFDKGQIVDILEEMRDDGLLCPRIVNIMIRHYDQIMDNVKMICQPVLKAYEAIYTEYGRVLAQCKNLAGVPTVDPSRKEGLSEIEL